MRCIRLFRLLLISVAALIATAARADEQPRVVSFTHDIVPLFNRSCVACHKPGKLKGKLDLSTFGGLSAGGENGATVIAGNAEKSSLVQQISGDKPAMPAKGEPLSPAEVERVALWVKQGAKDDTPAGAVARKGYASPGPTPPTAPPVYAVAPTITALAYSPDGQFLAVAGREEVLLHKPDGSGLLDRLPSGIARMTGLVFSDDGKFLAAAGGSPGQSGIVQVWEMPAKKLIANYRVADDTIFGLSFSPTADRVVFGCADRTVRLLQLSDGKELARLEPHTDWAFGAAFTLDGRKIVSGGRDKAVELTDLSNPRISECLNDPREGVLCIVRHPTKDVVLTGSDRGAPQLYKLTDLQRRTEEKRDPNLIKEMERLPGAIFSVAFSHDGAWMAAAGLGEARVFDSAGNRKSILPGNTGAVFTLAFSADGKQIATAGYDGQVRVFEVETGKPAKIFVPVLLGEH